jgi:type III pantothenate kinase
MKLYVDVGNSAVKWAYENDLLAQKTRREYVQDLAADLDRIWGEISSVPSEVHVACVRHRDVLDALLGWVAQHWRVPVKVSQTQSQELGVINGYKTPERLGVDRWLALLAARSIATTPTLIVDCGTATTVDAIDERGQHLGGVILPGLKLMPQCLAGNTALEAPSSGDVFENFATDPVSGIQSGAILAHISVIEQSVQALQSRVSKGATVRCMLTGGDAELLLGYLKIPHQYVPDLVLQGLALQAEKIH